VGLGWGRAGRDRGRALVTGAWGAGSRDGQYVGNWQRGAEERGERGRTKKQAGFINWALMFLGRAEELEDPPYVSQLPDVAEEHKYPSYIPRLGQSGR
jgi:hypothetical protein